MDPSDPRELKRTAIESPTKDAESKKSRLEESPNEAIPGPSHAEFEPNPSQSSIGQEIEDIIKCLPTRPNTPTPMKSLMSYGFNRLNTDSPVRFLETPPLEEVLGTEESGQCVGTEQSQIPQQPMMEDTRNVQPENQGQEPYYEWWKPEPQYPTEAFATTAQEPNYDNNIATNEWALANFIRPEWGIPVPQSQWQLRESTPVTEEQDDSIYIVSQEEQPEIRHIMDENKELDEIHVENIPQEHVLPEIRVTVYEDDKVEEEADESIFIIKEEGKPPVVKLNMDEDDK